MCALPTSHLPPPTVSRFSDHLFAAIRTAHLPSRPLATGECQSSAGKRCPLCLAIDLDYKDEAALKNQALQEFWKAHRLGSVLDPLVISPRGRAYRTVTKRRAFTSHRNITLGLIDPDERGGLEPFNVVHCAIEPVDHARIYAHTQDSLANASAEPLAAHLNYVIIKGNYTEYTLIFNVREISPAVMRATNTLSKSLTRTFNRIGGLFLFVSDPRAGRIPSYYLEARRTPSHKQFKKIYGKKEIYHNILGRSFLYSPLCFSQVNQSLVEPLILCASELLKIQKRQTLFDLYCGYGPFSLCLSDRARRIIGAELSPVSVSSAVANAERQHVSNSRFICADITAVSIQDIARDLSSRDIAILDPPRGGVSEEVIERLAAKGPARVLHIVCNIDLLPSEIRRWARSGYNVVKAVPFDMFPGTPEVEIMVLLEPS